MSCDNDFVFSMARGDIDLLCFGLYVDDSDTPTDMLMDDIYFTVKKHYENRSFIFQKRLSDGSIVSDGHGAYTITIQPEDTDEMEFGEYTCDIEVVKAPGIKKTFPGLFVLTKEVTHRGNEVL